MSNIKTSDPHTDLKPVELTPSELNSVAGGLTPQETAVLLLLLRIISQPGF
jgi:hypothetical protein